ncbi:MAG: hypothetical protein WCF57_10665 [Pyrinomonadaceae bacterium]
MQTKNTYEALLAASESIRWRVEDIIGGDKRLDFTRPFMPESLARVEQLSFLTPYEQRTLNQIRGNAYLCIFGLVEEFILPFVLDHAKPQLRDDAYRIRALLQFAGEEAKHIHLFKCFRQDFASGFCAPCGVIGPPEQIASAVLSYSPLAVGLVILHIEWMTQSHYVESVKDDRQIDPQFKSLLRHHWMEEAQHAKLDKLMVEALAAELSEAEIERGVEEYIEIGGLLDSHFMRQVELDMKALMRATRRSLTENQKNEFREIQRQANRWTYLGSGMTHANFLMTLESLSPAARERVESIAPSFC